MWAEHVPGGSRGTGRLLMELHALGLFGEFVLYALLGRVGVSATPPTVFKIMV